MEWLLFMLLSNCFHTASYLIHNSRRGPIKLFCIQKSCRSISRNTQFQSKLHMKKDMEVEFMNEGINSYPNQLSREENNNKSLNRIATNVNSFCIPTTTTTSSNQNSTTDMVTTTTPPPYQSIMINKTSEIWLDYCYRFNNIGRLYEKNELALERLWHSKVCVIGLGGVGSWVCESLVRSGIRHITLIDFDDICLSNINRQIHALSSTVGGYKADVLKQRMLDINPYAIIHIVYEFITPQNIYTILNRSYYEEVIYPTLVNTMPDMNILLTNEKTTTTQSGELIPTSTSTATTTTTTSHIEVTNNTTTTAAENQDQVMESTYTDYMKPYDVIIDTADKVMDKAAIVDYCVRQGIMCVVSGGAGGLIDPTLLRTSDLSRAVGDNLIMRVRKKLRQDYNYPSGENKKNNNKINKTKQMKLWNILAVHSLPTGNKRIYTGGNTDNDSDNKVCDISSSSSDNDSEDNNSVMTDISTSSTILTGTTKSSSSSTKSSSFRACDISYGNACFATGTLGFILSSLTVNAIAKNDYIIPKKSLLIRNKKKEETDSVNGNNGNNSNSISEGDNANRKGDNVNRKSDNDNRKGDNQAQGLDSANMVDIDTCICGQDTTSILYAQQCTVQSSNITKTATTTTTTTTTIGGDSKKPLSSSNHNTGISMMSTTSIPPANTQSHINTNTISNTITGTTSTTTANSNNVMTSSLNDTIQQYFTPNTIELIDAHCHLQFPALTSKLESVLTHASTVGIRQMIVCGTCPGTDWDNLETLYGQYPTLIRPQFGLHPWRIRSYLNSIEASTTFTTTTTTTTTTNSNDLLSTNQKAYTLELNNDSSNSNSNSNSNINDLKQTTSQESKESTESKESGSEQKNNQSSKSDSTYTWPEYSWQAALESRIKSNPLYGVGECGLDKAIRKDVTLEIQTDIVRDHFIIASQYHRSITLHCVNAWGRLYDIIEDYASSNSLKKRSKQEGHVRSIILHACNSMPIEFLSLFNKIPNLYYSLTVKSLSPREILLCKQIPLDRLLLETDSPDQLSNELKSVFPCNEPGLLSYGCHNIANNLNITYDELARMTYGNARRAFIM